MIRVFIADDHDIVRTGLRRVLDEIDDMSLCGEAGTTEELFAGIADAQPDVLVLDINMPGSKGVRTVTELLALPSPPAIAVFTMYGEDAHAVSYLRAGAMAFLSKKRSSMELIRAIRKIHGGERYITEALADHLFERGLAIEETGKIHFSHRELQVIRLLCTGLTSVKVAEEIGINPSTVNTHVQRIKEKIGVTSILEIIRFAEHNNLAQ